MTIDPVYNIHIEYMDGTTQDYQCLWPMSHGNRSYGIHISNKYYTDCTYISASIIRKITETVIEKAPK